MTSKPESSTKTQGHKGSRKAQKGVAETSRLFIDVDEIIRRPLMAPLTRYVE